MWPLLIGTVAATAAFGVGLSRLKWLRWYPSPWVDKLIDFLCLALAGVAGYFLALEAQRAFNPTWCPIGQDHQEYLSYVLNLLDPQHGRQSPYRYPLYPWLAALVCQLRSVPPYFGAMLVAFASAAAFPMALYWLLSALCARPVALAGALLAFALPPVMVLVPQPGEYMFCALVQVLCTAGGVHALKSTSPFKYFVFGLTLALFMAATPKAFVVLLVAVPLTIAALSWQARRAGPRVFRALALFLVPLVFVWEIFAFKNVEIYPLEHAVFKIQTDLAIGRGEHLVYPPHEGWRPGFPQTEGTWRVGRLEALLHIPGTMRSLAYEPQGFVPKTERTRSLERGLKHDLRLADLRWLALALGGCCGAGLLSSRAPRGSCRRVLPAVFLLVLTLGQLGGLTRSIYMSRYALPVLVLLPGLVLAGASWSVQLLCPRAMRRHGLAMWACPLLFVALLLKLNVPDDRLEKLKQRPELWRQAQTPVLCALRNEVTGRDGFTVLSPTIMPYAMFLGRTQFGGGVNEPDAPGVWIEGSTWRRRFIVAGCFDRLQDGKEQARWKRLKAQVAGSPELREFGDCVLEDLAPRKPLLLWKQQLSF